MGSQARVYVALHKSLSSQNGEIAMPTSMPPRYEMAAQSDLRGGSLWVGRGTQQENKTGSDSYPQLLSLAEDPQSQRRLQPQLTLGFHPGGLPSRGLSDVTPRFLTEGSVGNKWVLFQATAFVATYNQQ